jgi:DNA-directed RNA polymerase specialized sigma24 family protein
LHFNKIPGYNPAKQEISLLFAVDPRLFRTVRNRIVRRVNAFFPTFDPAEVDSAAGLGIAEALPSFDPSRSTLDYWLFYAGYHRTLNVLLPLINAKRVVRAKPIGDMAWLPNPVRWTTPEQEFLDLAEEALPRVLKKLSPAEKDAFLKFHVEGLSYEDISEDAKSVDNALDRARRKISDILLDKPLRPAGRTPHSRGGRRAP